MTTGGSSLADASTPIHSATGPSGRSTSTQPKAHAELAIASETTWQQQQQQLQQKESGTRAPQARNAETSNTLQPPNDGGNNNTVVVVGCDSIQTIDDVVGESSQSAEDNSQPVDEAVDNVQTVTKAHTQEDTKQADQDQSTQMLNTQTPAKRPSRVAATATNALLSRLAREEGASMSSLIATALISGEKGPEQHLRKRPTATVGPAAKKSRVTASSSTSKSRKAPQNTLENTSARQQSFRGKKRRQAPVFEPAPIITDLPPLPFTTTPEGKNKHKSKTKYKTNYAAEQVEDAGGRRCDYCNKVANLCVLMHCTACRRVYHAQCLVHTFKAYVDTSKPIEDQMERLKLEAPERRGAIFRCLSCKAAFMDFYETGGYLWDCSCPTCVEPEKVVYYRQRKLVDMMNEMELERQRKKEKKGGKKPVVTVKTPAPTPSRSNARGRRARSSSHEPKMLLHSAPQESQSAQEAEPMDDAAKSEKA
ncbi:hypothetical protein BBP00_00002096 [Phytophthora kernoviae]|uniref:Uncharacterized protein n=1 Tax=Phytophthora kernoviae TaxID=325452 RepID=A0A3F2RYC1_9STRA|nr:hypothetical protein BBP00_00002096 [Phytophthora kernoviae]